MLSAVNQYANIYQSTGSLSPKETDPTAADAGQKANKSELRETQRAQTLPSQDKTSPGGNQKDAVELSKEAEEVTAGSEGLLFIPLQIYRKGTIHGLAWNHSRGHMIRSILESAALSAQMYLGLIEAIARTKITEVKADGGGMNSDLWAQILADVMNKKVIIPEVKDSSALGAAILGFYGCKNYNSIDNAIEKMVRFEKEFNPDKANLKVYKKLNRLFMPTVLEIYRKKRVTKGI